MDFGIISATIIFNEARKELIEDWLNRFKQFIG